MENNDFKFNISLSILNHLGRNLYRSFTTVLGEAISNSWDADAQNVWINVDRENNCFWVKDDGIGMTSDDFQNKLLKIGYSKRKLGGNKSPSGRPYIGRKGIGKLALLSCADTISIISKVKDSNYVGGMIDNTELDKAILDDVSAHDYKLNYFDSSLFEEMRVGHSCGTIICFEGIKDGVNNTDDFLRKIIALYFRFSLLDPNFNIYLNENLITTDSLEEIATKTQFIWNINDFTDPYLDLCTKTKEIIPIKMNEKLSGFIASVKKPKDRNIHSTGERVGVDLFVNGRLRESDILKHIPSARVPESYLYGQIHFNSLDNDSNDPFTSSRESVVADNLEYKEFLKELKSVVSKIIDQWDELRDKYREDGDPDNKRISLKQRRATELANASFNEFIPQEESENKNKIEEWCRDLLGDAKFNFESYADCFVGENLVRKSIQHQSITLDSRSEKEVNKWRLTESNKKIKGNLSISIRNNNNDLFYLDMENLVKLAEPERGHFNTLLTDEHQFTPIRDAVMHTSVLTNEAKIKLSTVFDNIKARIKNILNK